MKEFRTKLSKDGRIILPAKCRQMLHLKPFDDIIIFVDDHQLRLISLKHSVKDAQRVVKKYAKNKSLVKFLKEMREDDFKNE